MEGRRVTLERSATSRRGALMLLGALPLVLAGCGKGEDGTKGDKKAALTDLRDRPLDLTSPATPLTIDDGRYLIALSLIHPDPVSLLSGWSGDVNRISPEQYKAYVARFPKLATLPKTSNSSDEFSVEAVLAAAPKAAIVSLGSGPTDAQVSQLTGAKVGVVFIDFFSHPFENQPRSLTLLGRLIGREEQAAAYNKFRQDKLDVISKRVASIPADKRPTVFLEAHAGNGPDCCNSPGKGNVGDYISFVGGKNIGEDVIKAPFGKLNLEYVIDKNPDVYIATGGPHLEKAGGFVVGPQYDEARSRASLKKVTERRGISSLAAISAGRVHGLSHQLINSPIDIVATEALAKWIHPDLFGDLDPQATLAAINKDFLAVPYEGSYWTDLQPSPAVSGD
ncbi:iron complex transport system substrate-binding protein [Sphingopyxis sp. YR583]|nr:iron complex transport system substrate-binding protein [Sphingopyxis sp. YR583]